MTGWPSLNLSATSCAESKRRGRTVYGSAPSVATGRRWRWRVDRARLHAGVVGGRHRTPAGDDRRRGVGKLGPRRHGAHRAVGLVVAGSHAAPRGGSRRAVAWRRRRTLGLRRGVVVVVGIVGPETQVVHCLLPDRHPLVLLPPEATALAWSRSGTHAEQRAADAAPASTLPARRPRDRRSSPSSTTASPSSSNSARTARKPGRAASGPPVGRPDRHQPVDRRARRPLACVDQRRRRRRQRSRPCSASPVVLTCTSTRAPGARLASSATSDGRSTVS